MAQLTIDECIQLYGLPNAMRCARAACQATARHVGDMLEEYPPTTESNQPGRWTHPAENTRRVTRGGMGALDIEAGSLVQPRPMGYYERNRGYWSPRMNITRSSFGHFGKAAGRIKAKRNSAVAGYVLTSHSEMLGKMWIVEPISDGALLINSASYARFVHDAKKQARIHAEHGWQTIQAAITRALAENVPGEALMQALRNSVR